MKNPVYLIILLALGHVFTTYKWVAATSSPEANQTVEKSTVDDIMTRTSVRAYSDRPVAKETVDTLLRAAMAAPKAGNRQPWRFVVIDDKSTLEYIGHNFKTMSMAGKAQLAVVMCGDVNATFSGEGVGYWIQDVSAASENLLLAAHAMGLGAVWCGIYPMTERVEQFSSRLALPADIIPMACICIGYPAGPSTPKDKWHPEYVHYNTWADTGAN